jgi:L-fucose mutarotase/ribose pyranase (RbsD/FucU family)
MEIPKEMVLNMLRERGQGDQVAQADQELPGQVDPEQHGSLLSKFGLDPGDLLKLAGGGGGLGGKLGL